MSAAVGDSQMNRLVPVSAPLAKALGLRLVGGEATRFEVGIALARAMQLNTSQLGKDACSVLVELLPALEAFADPGEAIRGAHKVVSDIADECGVDTLLTVFDELGMSYFEPPLKAQSTHQFRRDIRLRLREVLDPRVFQMIEGLRLGGPKAGAGPSRLIRSKD